MKTKILIIVGSTYPLNRLVNEIDKIGENGKYNIFAQIGESNEKPKNIESKKFLNQETLQKKINWADLVISHAGAGTLIDCLSQNKQLILFPRLKKFGEAVDDHQVEICEAFKKKYKIQYTLNEKEIEKLIKLQKKPVKILKERKLIKEIKKLLN